MIVACRFDGVRAAIAAIALSGLMAPQCFAQTPNTGDEPPPLAHVKPSPSAASRAGAAKPHATKPAARVSKPTNGSKPANASKPGSASKPASAATHANLPIPPPPPVPPAPPPGPVLPPAIVVPVRPPPPPLPATVMLDAAGEATPGKDGLRLTFGADTAALNPAMDAAIRALAHQPQVVPATDFTVTAFAKALPDDPSAARRLSLSRALAVRSVLINEGVTSMHIYVKALGAPPPEDMPADRVDIATSQNQPTPRSGQ